MRHSDVGPSASTPAPFRFSALTATPSYHTTNSRSYASPWADIPIKGSVDNHYRATQHPPQNGALTRAKPVKQWHETSVDEPTKYDYGTIQSNASSKSSTSSTHQSLLSQKYASTPPWMAVKATPVVQQICSSPPKWHSAVSDKGANQNISATVFAKPI